MPIRGVVLLCLLAFPSLVRAADTPASHRQELAASMRGLLLANLPDPLAAKQQNWGNQVEKVFGHGKTNHGIWRKVRVTAMDPANSLTLVIRNMLQPSPNLTQFELVVGLDVQIDFEQQFWDH